MHRRRLRVCSSFIAGVLAMFVLAAHSRGQTPDPAPGAFTLHSLPAIDRGLVERLSRSPDSAESRLRASLQTVGRIERVGSSGARYVAGRLIVKFRGGASPSARASTMVVASARASTRPSYADFDILAIDPEADAEALAHELAARPDVEYAQPDYRVHTQLTPNDSLYSRQWNLPEIDMERAWDVQPAAGSMITVAVVDTGVAYANVTRSYRASAFSMNSAGDIFPPGGNRTQYPALGNLTLTFVAAPELGPSSRFVSPHDFIWDTDVPVDLDGHGTHVSGTIGQNTNNGVGTAGVAFNVKLMPVKVLDTQWDEIFGSPNIGTDSVVAQGIRYAADNGAKVINMSLARTGGAAPAVEDAVRYAVGKGAFVAMAGGNFFEEGNPTNVVADVALRVRGAVAVAAIDRSRHRAYYSNTGNYIELAAPGGSLRGFGAEGGIIQQTLDLDLVETFTSPPALFRPPRFDAVAYFYFSGTSQATPHVAGVAAMLMQQGITDPAAVEAALERFAIDPSTRKPRGGVRDNELGFGEISARDTLRGLGLAK